MSFCPPQTEDALLPLGHLEGLLFPEELSVLRHLIWFFLSFCTTNSSHSNENNQPLE